MFRNPLNLEKYDDVLFDLDGPGLNVAVGNGDSQKKDSYRFVVDTTNELSPLDWFSARFSIKFKVNILTDGANLQAADHNASINHAASMIDKLQVRINGRQLYDITNAQHIANIKRMFWSKAYDQSVSEAQYSYQDTSLFPEERTAQANYNKGFSRRKQVLGASLIVQTEIPLNIYSFFSSLNDKILPPGKIEVKVSLTSDNDFCWQNGGECRYILYKFQLQIPRLVFNAEGQSLYSERFLTPQRWNFEQERLEISRTLRSSASSFLINVGVKQPKHVFVFMLHTDKLNSQTHNFLHYDTFKIGGNNRTLQSCHLEVGNGTEIPSIHFSANEDVVRVFRSALKCNYLIDDNDGPSCLLSYNKFKTMYPFIYFDLRNLDDNNLGGLTKLTFHYRLSGDSDKDFQIYALVLNTEEAEIYNASGKVLIRT